MFTQELSCIEYFSESINKRNFYFDEGGLEGEFLECHAKKHDIFLSLQTEFCGWKLFKGDNYIT
jgi:hypothetical protein